MARGEKVRDGGLPIPRAAVILSLALMVTSCANIHVLRDVVYPYYGSLQPVSGHPYEPCHIGFDELRRGPRMVAAPIGRREGRSHGRSRSPA